MHDLRRYTIEWDEFNENVSVWHPVSDHKYQEIVGNLKLGSYLQMKKKNYFGEATDSVHQQIYLLVSSLAGGSTWSDEQCHHCIPVRWNDLKHSPKLIIVLKNTSMFAEVNSLKWSQNTSMLWETICFMQEDT